MRQNVYRETIWSLYALKTVKLFHGKHFNQENPVFYIKMFVGKHFDSEKLFAVKQFPLKPVFLRYM